MAAARVVKREVGDERVIFLFVFVWCENQASKDDFCTFTLSLLLLLFSFLSF